MSKFAQLIRHLKSETLLNRCRYDAYIEAGHFSPSGKSLGNAITLARIEYSGVLEIENYSGSAELLGAQISAWMIDNAGNYDDANFEFEADKVADGLFDVDISLRFCEDINIVPNDAGSILLSGKRYEIEEPELWVATEFAITAELDADS